MKFSEPKLIKIHLLVVALMVESENKDVPQLVTTLKFYDVNDSRDDNLYSTLISRDDNLYSALIVPAWKGLNSHNLQNFFVKF